MKTILLWDPRFPDRRPSRLTVEDTVASAAIRAGVAAAANPAEAGALSAGGALDPTMLTEVVLQHGSGGLTRRVFLPYSVVMVGALAGVLASIGTPIPSGVTPTPTPTPTPMPTPSFIMNRLATALNATKAGTADTYYMTVGDSTSMGNGSGDPSGTTGARPYTTTSYSAARFKALGYPTSTDAFFGSAGNATIGGYAAYNPAVAVGGWAVGTLTSAGGVNFEKTSATPGALVFTPTDPCDVFDVYTVDGPGYGTLTISVDGGTATQVAQAAGAIAIRKTTVATGAMGAHTIAIDSLDATKVNLLGIIARSTTIKRMIIINAGVRGWAASDWKGVSQPYAPSSMLAYLAPHGADVALGINDFRDGSTLTEASFRTQMQVVFDALKSTADIVLRGPNDISPASSNGTLTMPQVGAVLYSMATTQGFGYIDTIGAMGDYTTVNNAGNMYDNLHPKRAYYTSLGPILANYEDAAIRRGGYSPVAPTPTVSLSAGQSKAEGNSGATLYTYTVTRSVSIGAINVPWAFSAGITNAADYTGGVLPTGGSIAIADGVTTGAFAVSVNGDTTVEQDETFSVNILAPSGYSLGSASASGAIVNDDSAAPSPGLTDAFTATDGSLLSAHTADTGQSWAQFSTGWTIANNKVYAPAANTVISAVSSFSGQNIAMEADLEFTTIQTANLGVAVRVIDKNTGYMGLYRSSQGGWVIAMYNGNTTFTQISPAPSGAALYTPSAGDVRRVRLEASGSTLTLKVGGVTVATVTDTSIAASGGVGLAQIIGVSTATAGARIDNVAASLL
ncbi:hypothetical protein E5673_12835 [Sphingomonas sp. PAMC26645]|uniref:hypothetical protein n=1 Tax=Sphingomonas sp. PAMC26645 TaxID=2565555 RepID=UPI00109E2EDD|nr:hypothetical protein [Sphingomonas sp. PAMC26645]QCB42993.1 hypothetical protein E5673_12835 [Sphingomonas sp. PAMC26645]